MFENLNLPLLNLFSRKISAQGGGQGIDVKEVMPCVQTGLTNPYY